MVKQMKNCCLAAVGIVMLSFILSCEGQPPPKKKDTGPAVASGKISQPVASMPKTTPDSKPSKKPGPAPEKDTTLSDEKAKAIAEKLKVGPIFAEYDPTGKINPFLPLIQEKEESPAPAVEVEEKPKRILTPLEKLELNQIRLVAVIEMKNRKIAMVEEANGKGYEVTLGTYIGKNSGQVFDINPDGIVVKEYIKNYKGKREERFQEIKLHKKEE